MDEDVWIGMKSKNSFFLLKQLQYTNFIEIELTSKSNQTCSTDV